MMIPELQNCLCSDLKYSSCRLPKQVCLSLDLEWTWYKSLHVIYIYQTLITYCHIITSLRIDQTAPKQQILTFHTVATCSRSSTLISTNQPRRHSKSGSRFPTKMQTFSWKTNARNNITKYKCYTENIIDMLWTWLFSIDPCIPQSLILSQNHTIIFSLPLSNLFFSSFEVYAEKTKHLPPRVKLEIDQRNAPYCNSPYSHRFFGQKYLLVNMQIPCIIGLSPKLLYNSHLPDHFAANLCHKTITIWSIKISSTRH